jgi:hypothetical protein
MSFLSHLRIRTKLVLLVGCSALALIIGVGATGAIMRQRMLDDRIDKLRAVVLTTIGFVQSLQAQVEAHAIGQEQALVMPGAGPASTPGGAGGGTRRGWWAFAHHEVGCR